jgi:translation initiation factor 6 (eIF-6)
VTVVEDNLTKSVRVREPFVIGSRLIGATMRGRAAHVRLIPRELTAEEVRRLAEADRPPGPLP